MKHQKDRRVKDPDLYNHRWNDGSLEGHTLYPVQIMGRTKKAYLVRYDYLEFWIPRSQIFKTERTIGGINKITIPKWLLTKTFGKHRK